MAFDHRNFIRLLSRQPGVYLMLDSAGSIIYVGKARNLQQRVRSYFNPAALHSPKIRVLRERLADMQATVTHTENEALILESNLIKAHRPRYNVWFRDDKSYPYIHVSIAHDFPRFSYYRGPRRKSERYFGPFPNASSALQTLYLLQKLFQVRSCADSVFAHRTRPCLQHQIGRCSAPCVSYINKLSYRRSIDHACWFLEGRNEAVLQALLEPMQQAAAALDFERAALYRDQIGRLRKVQEKQYVDCAEGEVDIIVCLVQHGHACVEWSSVRGGLHLGSRAFYPHHDPLDPPEAILSAFLSQMWCRHPGHLRFPREILCNVAVEDRIMLEKILTEQAGHKVTIRHRLRGHRAKWLDMTCNNAALSLQRHVSGLQKQAHRLDDLGEQLQLKTPLQRIECFDISHTQGEATVASCVVFGPEGPRTRDYRCFNIRATTDGDDCRALSEAVQRRYTAPLSARSVELPDLLLVDGGKGQVQVAQDVLLQLGIDTLQVLGIAKGPSRKVGAESLILDGRDISSSLRPHSPAWQLLWQIRDEAHRFAIQAHRRRRGRARTRSALQDIEGVGPRRSRALLQHFGGMRGVIEAGVEDIVRVPGIHQALAQRIHACFHGAP